MELAPLDIDVAALNEVGFVDQGSLTEDGAGHTPYWSGKDKDDRRLSCVGPHDQNFHCQKIVELSTRPA